MTLKSLFSKAFWVRLSRRLSQFNWLTAIWSVVLFFVFPVAGALVFSTETREDYWTIARVSKALLVQMNFACAFSILMGILTPNAFNYLNSRRELDFYHSQPVTRKELFWRNYIVGWLSYIVPLTAGLILEAGVIMLIPGIAWENVTLMCKGYFACIGTYFSVNALCLLAVVLCGNRFISLLTGVYFCGAPAMLFGMFYYFVDAFSATFRYDIMGNILIGSSPLCYIFNLNASYDTEINNFYLWSVLGWTAVSVAVLFLARGLYLRRKSETAGKPLSFPKAILFIKYPLTVAAAWIGGLLFDAMTNSAVWMLFGAVTFGILTHCIISGLEKFEFRNAFRGWLKLLLCTGIFLTCILFTFIGCRLLDKRTTKDENIRSFDVYRIIYSEQLEDGIYYTLSDNLEDIEGEEAIKALNKLAKAGAKSAVNSGRLTSTGGSLFYADTVAPEEQEGVAYVNFHVRVNTVFGSYTREYSFYCDADLGLDAAVKDFAYSAGAKKAHAEYLLESIDTKAEKFSFRPNVTFPSHEKVEALYEALKADMAAATVEDYEEDPLGYVTINYSGRFYSWMDSGEQMSAQIPVYSCYKKTLELTGGAYVPSTFAGVGTFEETYWYNDADYDKGYSAGYNDGYERGKQNGQEGAEYYEYYTSLTDSYSEGYADGYRAGYEEGYNIYGDAYSDGYDVGYSEGYEAGKADFEGGFDMTIPNFEYNGTSYRDGYIEGFNTGYYDGYKNYSDANSTEPLE